MSTITMRAQATWSGSGVRTTTGARGFRVDLDEPKEIGGTNLGMNPMEFLLSALGGCMIVMAAKFAPEVGVDLDDAYVELEGDMDPAGYMGMDESVRKGFQEIRAKLVLVSSSAPERVEELRRLVEGRCPVTDTLLKGVSIRVALEHQRPQ